MLRGSNPLPYIYETLNDARKRIRDKIHFPNASFRTKPALDWTGGSTYRLRKEEDVAWIEIDDHSAYIRRTSKGIAIEIIDQTRPGELITIERCGVVLCPKK